MGNHQSSFTTNILSNPNKKDNPAADSAPKTNPSSNDPSLTQGERFVCARCGADITRASLRIAVGGLHRHTLQGSYGTEEIGCFSLAQGCTLLGPFALDLNAADGEWRMVICATCGEDLGWHYQTDACLGFFGLILDNLEAAPEDTGEDPA
ncbi:MAG: cereblon family protein [Solidesulfovibrio sp.]